MSNHLTPLNFTTHLMTAIIFFALGMESAEGANAQRVIDIPFNVAAKEQKIIFPLIKSYIPSNIKATFFYKGRLVDQVSSGFEILSTVDKSKGNNTIVMGWRHNDADNQSIAIINHHNIIRLVAIRTVTISVRNYTNIEQSPLIAIFYRNKNNLKYVHYLTGYLSKYSNHVHYKTVFYDLNKCSLGKPVSVNICKVTP